jgi:hypothetical protein
LTPLVDQRSPALDTLRVWQAVGLGGGLLSASLATRRPSCDGYRRIEEEGQGWGFGWADLDFGSGVLELQRRGGRRREARLRSARRGTSPRHARISANGSRRKERERRMDHRWTADEHTRRPGTDAALGLKTRIITVIIFCNLRRGKRLRENILVPVGVGLRLGCGHLGGRNNRAKRQ